MGRHGGNYDRLVCITVSNPVRAPVLRPPWEILERFRVIISDLPISGVKHSFLPAVRNRPYDAHRNLWRPLAVEPEDRSPVLILDRTSLPGSATSAVDWA
ncbi:hypothetical protein OPQ81_010890 [Rhizoctonia solani]|nr:hypothetical protein OPQ81_010890 [Rhizoctonia solani]